MAQASLPAIDEETGRRRISLLVHGDTDHAVGESVGEGRGLHGEVRRISSAPAAPDHQAAPDRSRMRRQSRRASTSSGMFSGTPSPGPQPTPSLPERSKTVKPNQGDQDSPKLAEMREKRRQENFLHRQDSRPLLLNVERGPPLTSETDQLPLEAEQMVEEAGMNGGRHRANFSFRGRTHLRGLTNGVSKFVCSFVCQSVCLFVQ